MDWTGTFPYNVESGIDSFISAYSTSSLIGDSIYGWGSGGNTLRNKIQNLRPVCVSTLAEPQYGNHWVLVYDYIDYSSISYYKIVDNHGNYSTTIGTGWVSSYVYINN